MTWRGWFSFVLCVSSVFFFGSVITTDANAVSDVTLTLDDSNRESFLCRTDIAGVPNCYDYDYIYVTFSGSLSSNDLLNYFTLGINGQSRNLPLFVSFIDISSLKTDINRIYISTYSSSYQYGISAVNFLLTNDNPFGAQPSGSLSITENGTYDVSSYAEAVVNVPPTVIQGDYHDDLVSINNTILIGCAVPLVIYFFYGIYKMILGALK